MLCTFATDSKIQDVLNYITCFVSKSILPLIFTVAIVLFVWGIVQFFIIGSGEEAKRTQGKQFMIWGILAMAVILSLWGLVRILGSTFGLNTSILPGTRPSSSSNFNHAATDPIEPGNFPITLPGSENSDNVDSPIPCEFSAEGCGGQVES
mgnify:FL=1